MKGPMMKKTEYVKPSLEELGRFESMTKSTNAGDRLDANFNGRAGLNIIS